MGPIPGWRTRSAVVPHLVAKPRAVVAAVRWATLNQHRKIQSPLETDTNRKIVVVCPMRQKTLKGLRLNAKQELHCMNELQRMNTKRTRRQTKGTQFHFRVKMWYESLPRIGSLNTILTKCCCCYDLNFLHPLKLLKIQKIIPLTNQNWRMGVNRTD